MYIANKLLIATITTIVPAMTGANDLCGVVDRVTGTPTICEPHKQGAPIYDAEVCCAGSTCYPAGGGCQGGEVLYYCSLGEVTPTGEVACYFEVPEYCDVFPCQPTVAPPPLNIPICCNQGVCWEHVFPNDCEVNDIKWCSSGVSNSDGTITCLDEAS